LLLVCVWVCMCVFVSLRVGVFYINLCISFGLVLVEALDIWGVGRSFLIRKGSERRACLCCPTWAMHLWRTVRRILLEHDESCTFALVSEFGFWSKRRDCVWEGETF